MNSRPIGLDRQQIPGPLDKNGVFDRLNGAPIRWTDRTGLTHIVVGADHAGENRLLWTLCNRDVPANKAWLLEQSAAYEICAVCANQTLTTDGEGE